MRHAWAALAATLSAGRCCRAVVGEVCGGEEDERFFSEGFLDPLRDPENITGSSPRPRGRCPLFGAGCFWHPRWNPDDRHERFFRLWRRHFSGPTSREERADFYDELLSFRQFVLLQHLDPDFSGYLPSHAWAATPSWAAAGPSAADGPPAVWLRRHRDVHRFFRRVCLPSVLISAWATGRANVLRFQEVTPNFFRLIASLLPGGYCGSDTQLARGAFRVFGFAPQQIGYFLLAGVPPARAALGPAFARRALQLREAQVGRSKAVGRRRNPMMVMDVGLGMGVDSYFYLMQGFHVVAVDANTASLRAVSRGLRPSIENSTLLLVRAVLLADEEFLKAAVTGSREKPFFSLARSEVSESSQRVPASGAMDTAFSTMPGRVDLVRATTCGELVRAFGVPHYLKVDVEDDTIPCALSLGRALASLRRDYAELRGQPGPPITPPAYISVELRDFPRGHMGTATTKSHLEALVGLGYRCFKLARQDIYLPSSNIRRVYGEMRQAQLADSQNSVGVGVGSGPFGEDAVDVLYGSRWRSAEAVLSSLQPVRDMAVQLPEIYFDLHAKWGCEPR